MFRLYVMAIYHIFYIIYQFIIIEGEMTCMYLVVENQVYLQVQGVPSKFVAEIIIIKLSALDLQTVLNR